jgi:DNA-binding SARP family transcriptional activator
VQYRVLGPLEVARGGTAIDLGGPKQRAVLAVLLIDANRVVSLDRLIDQLWGDEPPPRAMSSLQAYISNLRRALEPERAARTPAQVLVTQAPGYLLRVDPADVDATRFEQLVADGHRLLDAGDPGAAQAALREGLALWRGDAFADFAFESFAAPEIARLEELRAGAVEAEVAARLALGEHRAAIGDLERLVASYPLREQLRSLQVLALYRCGRQADALRALAEARTMIAKELGLPPSPELQQLESRILQQDPELEWTPARGEGATSAPGDAHADTEVTPAHDDGLPSAPSSPAAADLVGRDAQIARLEEALAAARAGRGSVVLIAGEPGVGKTRLAEALADRATGVGVEVVWGRCYEGEGAPAFWPWAQALRSLVANRTEHEIGAALRAANADVSQLVPEVAPLTPALPIDADVNPEAARFQLYDSVCSLLQQLAEARPLLVVIDDLHWSDTSSLRLLQYLATEMRGDRILVVATYRDTEVVAGHPLAEALTALVRDPTTERWSLEGLERDSVARYVAITTGLAVDETTAATLHERTDGNPFYLTELVRLLTSEGSLAAPDAARHEVPAGVRDVIRRRIARLPEKTQRVLTVAAVIGREFGLDELELACELDGDDVLDLVEAALVTGIVTEVPDAVGRYRFAHALVRETLYDSLSSVRRGRVHVRVGAAIEERWAQNLDSHLDQLAHHFAHGTTAEAGGKTVHYARLAGDRAREQLAWEPAIELYEVALGAADSAGLDDVERADLLLDLGQTRKNAADFTGARDAFAAAAEAARRAGDPVRFARAALGHSGGTRYGVSLHFFHTDDASLALLEEANEWLPDDDSMLRADVLGRIAIELLFAGAEERRERLTEDALDIARRSGDDGALARALVARRNATWGDGARRGAIADELIEVGRRSGVGETIYGGHFYRAGVRYEEGDFAGARADLEIAEQTAADLRQPGLMTPLAWGRAQRAAIAGDFAEAERLMQKAFEAHVATLPSDAISGYAAQLFFLRRDQGRLREVEQSLREMATSTTASPAWTAALALLAAEHGDLDEARELFDAIAGAGLDAIPQDMVWTIVIAMLAEVAAALGDESGASALHSLLEPFSGRTVSLLSGHVILGPVDYFLGLLAATLRRDEEAVTLLERAVADADRVGMAPAATRARLRLAEVLARRDERDEALAVLDAVLDNASQLGMAQIAAAAIVARDALTPART